MFVGHLFSAIENKKKFKGEVFNHGLSNANLTKLELCLRIKNLLKILKLFAMIISQTLIKEITEFQIRNLRELVTKICIV